MLKLHGVRAALCSACAVLSLVGAAFGDGADVIVGDLPDLSNFTPTSTEAGFDSFAVGTTSCNLGNVDLNWYTASNSPYSWDNRHPVIGQNLYRMHNGRFEQIGQAWLKHGFTALSGNLCATCNGHSGEVLGVGCSDPYSSGLNGGQGGLGPKWQVNAANGMYRYPFTNSSGSGETYKRLRVRTADLSTTTYAGATYFIEGQYVCGDDAAANNKNNNLSWRRVIFSAASGTPAHFNIGFPSSPSEPTTRAQAAIWAWKAADPSVTIQSAEVPGDGQFILGCKVSGPVAGLYTYEYALHNVNSDRCAGSFSVPYPAGTTVSAIGFHDVEYHSGEPNAAPADPAADDWASTASATSVTWAGPSYFGTPASYVMSPTVPFMLAADASNQPLWTAGTGNDHSANVLRWGTLYNFRFQTTVAPAAGSIQIGLWRPGTGSTLNISIPTPGGASTGFVANAPCCTGTVCSIVAPGSCSGAVGTIGASCSPDPCATGACCTSGGACGITSLTGCTGSFQGLGTSCTPNNCPAPSGACCSSGVCTIKTQTTCTATYRGDSTVCNPDPCGSNDACANAITVYDNIGFNATNVGATTDYASGSQMNCGSGDSSGRDVWFKYTPATSANVRVTTDTSDFPAGTTNYDSVISVHTACGVAPIACDDDGGSSPTNSSNIAAVAMTGGTTYRIRVAGYGSTGASGLFTLRVIGGGGLPPAPPFNDACQNRQGVADGTLSFSTATATTDGPVNAGCGFSGNIEKDIWFNYPAQTTGNLTVSLCGSSFDTRLAIYLNPTCTDFDARLIACNDNFCGTASQLTIPIAQGSSYVLRIGGNGASTGGNGTLSLSSVTTVGACCDSNGSCHVFTTADCTSAGGSFLGLGSACGQSTCPQPGSCCDPATGDCGVVLPSQCAPTSAFTSGGSCTPNICPQPGACCNPASGACTLVPSADCSLPSVFNAGAACEPSNPCPQPTGACCTGTACSISTAAACSTAFKGVGSSCGPAGNPTTCCPANYNGTGGVSVQDIFDFLSAWFASSTTADFNGAGGVSVQDIFDFLSAWFAGCPG